MRTEHHYSGNGRLTRFSDREIAGRVLAGHLSGFRDRGNVVVLALPRGGVPVGVEVARELNLPLDVLVVRKLGIPGYPELAMGALGPAGVRILNDDVVAEAGVAQDEVERVTAQERCELERREQTYRGYAPPVNLAGRSAILVDDGLATGATMSAAVAAARKLGASNVVVAVPVATGEACERLAREADRVVCVMRPHPFVSVSQWYDDFPQVSDAEVRDLLERPAAGDDAATGAPKGRVRPEVADAEYGMSRR